MGWFPAATAIAGTVVSAYSQYQQGATAAETAEYNAQMARHEAAYQTEKAAREEEEHRQEVRRLIGEQAVKGAAAGGTGTGTEASILLETLSQAEIDAALIRYGGSVESWKAKSQASLSEAQAGQSRLSSFLDPAGTILGGAAKVDWGTFKTKKKTTFDTSKYRWSPRQ